MHGHLFWEILMISKVKRSDVRLTFVKTVLVYDLYV